MRIKIGLKCVFGKATYSMKQWYWLKTHFNLAQSAWAISLKKTTIMKSPILSLIITFITCSFATAQQKSITIYFSTNQFQLTQQAKNTLDESFSLLIDKSISSIQVSGHTDNIGSEQYNQQLSLKRALAVKEYLIQKGHTPELFQLEGKGSSTPITSNDNPSERQKNRRAALTITWKLTEKVIVKKEDDKQIPVEEEIVTIDTIHLQASDDNRYKFPNNAFVVITSKAGMEFTIEPLTFEGKEEDSVELIIKNEYFDISSIINDQLSTMSDKGPLSSRGMFAYQFKIDEKPATLRSERTITTILPIDESPEESSMNIYEAKTLNEESIWSESSLQYQRTKVGFLLRLIKGSANINCDIPMYSTIVTIKLRKASRYADILYCYTDTSRSVSSSNRLAPRRRQNRSRRKLIFGTSESFNSVTIMSLNIQTKEIHARTISFDIRKAFKEKYKDGITYLKIKKALFKRNELKKNTPIPSFMASSL